LSNAGVANCSLDILEEEPAGEEPVPLIQLSRATPRPRLKDPCSSGVLNSRKRQGKSGVKNPPKPRRGSPRRESFHHDRLLVDSLSWSPFPEAFAANLQGFLIHSPIFPAVSGESQATVHRLTQRPGGHQSGQRCMKSLMNCF
jgi:hypothetical protein